MGQNVNKCTLHLYNIPHDIEVPTFTSIAWSYDAEGPVQGNIHTVVMRRDEDGTLICYNVPEDHRPHVPKHIQDILAPCKYLGITTDAQLDSTCGKNKLFQKLSQRIAIISKNADSIQEAKVMHNMLVCQVATFSPLCASMNLTDCLKIDKQLLTAYQYRMKYLNCDTKHNIFISEKNGGIGVKCFTKEYVGALLRDLEVFISNPDSTTTVALLSSAEAATNLTLWTLNREQRIPCIPLQPNERIA